MPHDDEKAQALQEAHKEATAAEDAVNDEFSSLVGIATDYELQEYEKLFAGAGVEFEDLAKALRRLRYAQKDHKAASDAYLAALATPAGGK